MYGTPCHSQPWDESLNIFKDKVGFKKQKTFEDEGYRVGI